MTEEEKAEIKRQVEEQLGGALREMIQADRFCNHCHTNSVQIKIGWDTFSWRCMNCLAVNQ